MGLSTICRPNWLKKVTTVLLFLSPAVSGFSSSVLPRSKKTDLVRLSASRRISTNESGRESLKNNGSGIMKKMALATTTTLAVGILGISSVALLPERAIADEFGKETEAPTLFTGETVLICTKRGPLGACLETTERTPDNDNDKANRYFKDPSISLKEKYSAAQLQKIEDEENGTANDPSEGSALIQKLKQQSVDNKERNDKIVRQKTLQNDLGASFGPLDRQVVILNADGENYTLLEGPQAMRLKKAGYIKDRRFVTQPTQEIIDQALEAPEEGGLGGFVKGLFGGGDE